MMTPEAHMNAPARVSILERLVPSLGFAIAAFSGVIGGLMIMRVFNTLRVAETAGYAAFFGGIAEVEFGVGVVLVVAAIFTGIGVIFSAVRMFTTNTTSSPPGILLLLVGVISLTPPFVIHYCLHWMKSAVLSPAASEGGIGVVADTITDLLYVAMGNAVLVLVILLVFSFIPFSSLTGRKVLPLVCLIFVEILVVAFAGLYFWQARESIIERNRDRPYVSNDQYPEYDGPDDANSNGNSIAGGVDDYPGGTNSNVTSNSNSKTISGGVLNGKAIKFPQPPYPPAARAVRATGSVSVQVTVDEKGDVISANAVSGHPLLKSAAVQAARGAKFEPTKLSGKPVRVSGILTFNFTGE